MPTRESNEAEVASLRGLHLYHSKLSNNSMRVRLLLEAKALPWTSHLLDATQQDNLSEEYLRINPSSLIPAFVHDGVVVTESNDILLETQFPSPSFVPNEEGREAVDEWVDLAATSHPTTLKPWMYMVTGSRTKRPEDMERYRTLQSDEQLVAFHERSLHGFSSAEFSDSVQRNHVILARMEAALDDGDYLVDDGYSLADIAWFPNVLILDLLGFDMRTYPRVRQWLRGIRRRPAAGRAIGQSPFRLPGWLLRPIVQVRKSARRVLTR